MQGGEGGGESSQNKICAICCGNCFLMQSCMIISMHVKVTVVEIFKSLWTLKTIGKNISLDKEHEKLIEIKKKFLSWTTVFLKIIYSSKNIFININLAMIFSRYSFINFIDNFVTCLERLPSKWEFMSIAYD